MSIELYLTHTVNRSTGWSHASGATVTHCHIWRPTSIPIDLQLLLLLPLLHLALFESPFFRHLSRLDDFTQKRSFGLNGSRFSLQAGWWSSYCESTLSKHWKKIIHAHPQTTCHFHINLHYLVAPWSTDVMFANFCVPNGLPANDSLRKACGSKRFITWRKLYLAGGYIQTLKQGVQYVKWHGCLDNDSG